MEINWDLLEEGDALAQQRLGRFKVAAVVDEPHHLLRPRRSCVMRAQLPLFISLNQLTASNESTRYQRFHLSAKQRKALEELFNIWMIVRSCQTMFQCCRRQAKQFFSHLVEIRARV